jgi:hypothetical protein
VKRFGDGSKLYQRRARLALPLLVARAKAYRTFTYGRLAKLLDMPNPRNLNDVLGAVGHELEALSRNWKETIPPIECIVLNKTKRTPGRGIGFHMPVEQFNKLTPPAKKQVIHYLLIDIWGYTKWDSVLQHFDLTSAAPDLRLEELAAKARYGIGGGESQEHLVLKEYIARNPHVLGLPKTAADIEYSFPSADQIDVLFKYDQEWVGVEVKSINSDESDVLRGIFQCIKYRALIEAEQKFRRQIVSCRVLLVLGGKLPDILQDLAELLEVDVRENVKVPNSFTAQKMNTAAAR